MRSIPWNTLIAATGANQIVIQNNRRRRRGLALNSAGAALGLELVSVVGRVRRSQPVKLRHDFIGRIFPCGTWLIRQWSIALESRRERLAGACDAAFHRPDGAI